MSSSIELKSKSLMTSIACFFLWNGVGLAHEGHGIPGALPAAPHGGVVAESKELEERSHRDEHGAEKKAPGLSHSENEAAGGGHKHGENERELFFEAIYKDKNVRVYPLTFGKNTSTFVALSPLKDIKNAAIEVELPRAKIVQAIKPRITEEAFEFPFDLKKANRFIVHVSAEFDGEKRTSKLQIERNK